jgi:hypothetical protein
VWRLGGVAVNGGLAKFKHELNGFETKERERAHREGYGSYG